MTSGLRFLRLTAGAARPAQLLGERVLGAADDGLPLLWPAVGVSPVADAWVVGSAPHTQQQGRVHYTTDGQWLYGYAEAQESNVAGGLEAATRLLYDEIFAVLSTSACPHLLRVWNYLSGINGDDDGTERYRRFNVGRQQAFIDAQRSAFEGAPAACALGSSVGPLRVSFLAGRHRPLAIENPRQVSAYRYPNDYGPRSPTFSRAALFDAGEGLQALLISGTASITGHASVHLGDVRQQTEECLINIAAVREVASKAAGVGFAAQDMLCTIYVRNASDLPAVREVFEQHVGESSAAAKTALYVHADVCRAELLVEVEAHAFALSPSP